jgi:hypothetical protein
MAICLDRSEACYAVGRNDYAIVDSGFSEHRVVRLRWLDQFRCRIDRHDDQWHE